MKNVKLVLVVFYIFCFFSTNLAQKYDVQQLKSKYLSLESNLLKSKQNLKETFVSQDKLEHLNECTEILKKYPHASTGTYKRFRNKMDNVGNKFFCFMKNSKNISTETGFDCYDLIPYGSEMVDKYKEAVYTIKYENGELTNVQCVKSLNWNLKVIAWIAVQNRNNSDISFNRTYEEYVKGFGDINGNHWIGLEKLHRLTSYGAWHLIIEAKIEGNFYKASLYAKFKVGPGPEYRLSYYMFSTGIGDSDDVLKSQKGSEFKSYDFEQINENENDLKTPYCSYKNTGAWWKEKSTEKCEKPINLNAFNFEEMLFLGNKTISSRITIIRSLDNNEYKTLPVIYLEPLKTCEPDTCINGECVSTSGNAALQEKYPSGTYCKCRDGYWGENHCSLNYCHKFDPPVCKNGAACGYSDKSPFYTCFCMPGFKGKHCEQKDTSENTRTVVTKVESMDSFPPIRYNNPKIDECLPEFCVNGYCRDLDDTDPDWMYRVYPSGKKCQCSLGYQGHNHCSWNACTINIGMFMSLKGVTTFDAPVCKNGGGCIFQNIYPYYKCKCQPGFSGFECDIKDAVE